MDIIETLNLYIKERGKPYKFTTPIFLSNMGTVNHAQISLRVNDVRDKSYYDIVVIRGVFEDYDTDIRKIWKMFEHEMQLHLLFNNTTSGIIDLQGNPVKTFRDIMKIIMNDEIMPTR